MRVFASELRKAGCQIGFVPTMGALHEGHLSLVRRARQECNVVVASIFVNPTQFGPEEDYRDYPRDSDRDVGLLQTEGVDVVFAPSVDEVYPEGFQTTVQVGAVGQEWEGRSRPGHFSGVATVVLKLFNSVLPHRAYFGGKDAQQCAVIQTMVAELNLPVQIVVCPTVREEDGLALSSRNAYLNEAERQAAGILYRALSRAKKLVEQGRCEAVVLQQEMHRVIADEPLARVDYVAVVDSRTFQPVEHVRDTTTLALAVWIGHARLIDNIQVGKQNARSETGNEKR